MNKKVSITELMTETAVLTIGLTFYYWCWVTVIVKVVVSKT